MSCEFGSPNFPVYDPIRMPNHKTRQLWGVTGRVMVTMETSLFFNKQVRPRAGIKTVHF